MGKKENLTISQPLFYVLGYNMAQISVCDCIHLVILEEYK